MGGVFLFFRGLVVVVGWCCVGALFDGFVLTPACDDVDDGGEVGYVLGEVRRSVAPAAKDSIDSEFRLFLRVWLRRSSARPIESVLESHVTCASSFELSIVRILLETVP